MTDEERDRLICELAATTELLRRVLSVHIEETSARGKDDFLAKLLDRPEPLELPERASQILIAAHDHAFEHVQELSKRRGELPITQDSEFRRRRRAIFGISD